MSPPNFARTIYRALLQVSARRAISRMLANGLPPWLGPALSHLSRPVIAVPEQRILEPIDGFRTALRDRTDEPPKVFYSPEPQNRETGETNRVTPGSFERSAWEWIAGHACVTSYWGVFLYLCTKHKKPETILELGGCVGISACYLSAGNSNGQLITVEGAPELASIAEVNVRQINPRSRVVNAMFDDALDQWLPRLSGRLDLVHIDGQHERGSTLHYFERLKPHLHSGALVIFDDIHWSDDMRQVWREIATARGVSHSINVGRYGLCVWSGTAEPPRVHDFSRYARNWQIENRPMPSLC
jgi:predicted O-methyltransferase YrrM